MAECNVDSILKQMKALDYMKQINDLRKDVPELVIPGLDELILKKEVELQETLDVCGKIQPDELPEESADLPSEELTPAEEIELDAMSTIE